MVWKEIVTILREESFDVTEAQIRWALVSGKVDRPRLDASLRFEFELTHLDQLRRLFAAKQAAGER